MISTARTASSPMQEVICVPDRYQVSAAKWSTLQKKGIRKSFSLVSILAVMVKETANGERLSDAVSAALSVPALCRLRLGSLESVEVQPELLRLMQEDPRF